MTIARFSSASLLILMLGGFIATSGTGSATAASSGTDGLLPTSALVTDPIEEAQPNVSMSNFEMVKALDSAGKCLYNNSVFPAGGTGMTNSALPYDGLSDRNRAVATFRAELLRTYGADVAGVEPVVDDQQTVVGLTVSATPSSLVASTSLQKLASTVSNDFQKSLDTLAKLDIQIDVRPNAVHGFVAACPIQELIASGKLWASAGLSPETPAETVTNPETGQLELSVPKEAISPVLAALAPYGDRVIVSELIGDIEFQGRGESYSSRYGGSSLYSSAANETCSDGFRVGGNSLSTAGHCPNTNWASQNTLVSAGSTSSAYSQFPTVDINILFGQSYSNRIWVGTNYGSSTIPGVGVVSGSTVPVNGTGYYLFVGGAASAQGTVTITGKDVCRSIGGVYICNMYRATTTDSICYDGDSGTAWALYNGSGNLPALGSHSAGPAPTFTGATRTCYAAMMDKAMYNYGQTIY